MSREINFFTEVALASVAYQGKFIQDYINLNPSFGGGFRIEESKPQEQDLDEYAQQAMDKYKNAYHITYRNAPKAEDFIKPSSVSPTVPSTNAAQSSSAGLFSQNTQATNRTNKNLAEEDKIENPNKPNPTKS